ncbi:MAG: hypothetical protein PVI93_18980 [Desulfobacterales bacterium]
MDIWYLKEADIPAGSNSFDLTYSGTVNGQLHAWATFENVHQTSPFTTITMAAIPIRPRPPSMCWKTACR